MKKVVNYEKNSANKNPIKGMKKGGTKSPSKSEKPDMHPGKKTNSPKTMRTPKLMRKTKLSV